MRILMMFKIKGQLNVYQAQLVINVLMRWVLMDNINTIGKKVKQKSILNKNKLTLKKNLCAVLQFL